MLNAEARQELVELGRQVRLTAYVLLQSLDIPGEASRREATRCICDELAEMGLRLQALAGNERR